MQSRFAAALAALLLSVAVPLPSGASPPTIQNPPNTLVHGSTVTLNTDATTGTVTLYKPSTAGSSCFTQILTMPASYDGRIPGLELDRAGLWKLEHQSVAGDESTLFRVAPQALRILATASPASGGSYDYAIQVAQGPTKVPYAYLDAYYGASLVRHLRSDANGQVALPAIALPYAGSYRLVAYKDLGNPAFTYSNAFVEQNPAPCDGTYNAPELFQDGAEVGSGFSSVGKDTVPFNIQVTDGAIQVRHIPSTSTIAIDTPYGDAVTPSNVQLLVNGLPVSPSSLGLSLTVSLGQLLLSGSWDSPADVVVSLVADSNGDGVPEYTGTAQIQVRHDLPMRIVPVGLDGSPDSNPTLAYRVPAPNADGTPGRHILRFKVYDLDGHEGRPPAISASSIGIVGDLLPGAKVAYDAANGYWVATATPLNSDSDYRITIPWPDVGKVTFIIDMPRDGGAKTVQLQPVGHLVVAKRDEAAVQVQRFNPAAISEAKCQPLPNCAYENVTDAVVRLAWADTGLALLDPAGNPYEYAPGRAPGACDCYEYRGEYRFQNLVLNRSGLLVAIAKINVPSAAGTFQYSYMPFTVDPQPVYTPTFNPTRTLAGAFTRYAISSAGLSSSTLANFEIHIRDAGGHDIAYADNFTSTGPQVFFSAVLPEGDYYLTVQDRLDPLANPPQLGKKGTLQPGILHVVPADVRFTYTDAPLFPSTLGVNLQDALNVTYVLGGSLGKMVQLKVDAFGADGQRTPGTIRLEGFRLEGGAAHAFALLAYSDHNQPTTVGAPRLYAPDDPQLAWMCQSPGAAGPNLDDCGSYYFAELPAPNFNMVLDLPYSASPVLIYVFGVGVGDVRVSFLPAGSNLNKVEPTHSAIRVIPPAAKATMVSTRLGATTDQSLVVGIDNLVEMHGWDPTGYNTLDGMALDLSRTIYGPSQVPGGILHYAPGDSFGATHIALVPDASGPLNAYIVKEAAIVDTLARLPALDSALVQFNTSSIQVFVDLASVADEGSSTPIRVGTSAEPFPQGVVVRAFGSNTTLVSGSGSILVPFVEADKELPVIIHVPGLAPVLRTIRVHDLANQVRNMQITGMPIAVREGQAFTVTIKDGHQPLGAVSVQLLGTNTTSDKTGQATLQAPLVSKTMDTWVTFTKENYTVLQFPLQVINTASPQLVFDVQHTMEGGKKYTVTVKAVNERGDFIAVPTGVAASIEAQRAPAMHFDGANGASWTYEAPRLVQDVRVYLFAHVDGYEPAMTLVTIKAVAQ